MFQEVVEVVYVFFFGLVQGVCAFAGRAFDPDFLKGSGMGVYRPGDIARGTSPVVIDAVVFCTGF